MSLCGTRGHRCPTYGLKRTVTWRSAASPRRGSPTDTVDSLRRARAATGTGLRQTGDLRSGDRRALQSARMARGQDQVCRENACPPARRKRRAASEQHPESPRRPPVPRAAPASLATKLTAPHARHRGSVQAGAAQAFKATAATSHQVDTRLLTRFPGAI